MLWSSRYLYLICVLSFDSTYLEREEKNEISLFLFCKWWLGFLFYSFEKDGVGKCQGFDLKDNETDIVGMEGNVIERRRIYMYGWRALGHFAVTFFKAWVGIFGLRKEVIEWLMFRSLEVFWNLFLSRKWWGCVMGLQRNVAVPILDTLHKLLRLYSEGW